MFSKTLFIFLIVNLVAHSYGQRLQKKFRKDYTYVDAAESFYKIHTVPIKACTDQRDLSRDATRTIEFLRKLYSITMTGVASRDKSRWSAQAFTWADAKRVCALEGATFWHPENDKELRAVISFWEKTRPTVKWLWTGLSDMLVEGRFETVDGKPSSEVYINWQMSQPDNNGNEDCTHLGIIGDMNDYICDSKALFICEKTLQSLEWNHHCDMPNLDYTYSKNSGKCYKLHTTPLKWADANERCQLEQSTLAVISDQLEADFLVMLTESTPKPRVKGKYQRGIYHLGFHNRFSEGWQTVKGTPFKVHDVETWFDNYQPDGEEECGSMFFNGRLVNTDCDTKSFFICEHEVDNVITPASVSLSNLQPYVGGGIE